MINSAVILCAAIAVSALAVWFLAIGVHALRGSSTSGLVGVGFGA